MRNRLVLFYRVCNTQSTILGMVCARSATITPAVHGGEKVISFLEASIRDLRERADRTRPPVRQSGGAQFHLHRSGTFQAGLLSGTSLLRSVDQGRLARAR